MFAVDDKSMLNRSYRELARYRCFKIVPAAGTVETGEADGFHLRLQAILVAVLVDNL